MKIRCRIGWSALAGISLLFVLFTYIPRAESAKNEFTTDFRIEHCDFLTVGRNPYFILIPGYELVLEGEDHGEQVRVVISVLDKTKDVRLPGTGKVKTRIVKEREYVDGELAEISRNYFAVCKETNSVFYFGENVKIYERGRIVSRAGSWLAGENGAVPGLIMPGTFLLGSRYFQEIAPDAAMDRAKNSRMGLTVNTPAGTFSDCVKVVETTPLEKGERTVKIYAPGVGLIVDGPIELVN